jgi:hypothetical protein
MIVMIPEKRANELLHIIANSFPIKNVHDFLAIKEVVGEVKKHKKEPPQLILLDEYKIISSNGTIKTWKQEWIIGYGTNSPMLKIVDMLKDYVIEAHVD